MDGLMQDTPLSLDRFLWRAERLYGSSQVVSATSRGRTRTSFAEWSGRVARVAAAMDRLGLSEGARVASFCWSTVEHLELYFGVPCSRRVLHTLNLRLFADQLTYIVNHAEDEAVFVHRSLVPVLWPLLPTFSTVRHVVVIDDTEGPTEPVPDGIEVHRYEDLLAASEPKPMAVDDERRAAMLCYTGGTTGLPKGVLYSHRSLVLHAMSTMFAGGIGIHERDVAMPVVPMFHANAVGFAHAAVATGANLVLPGSDLSGPALADLLESERVSVTCGVPTVWTGVLPELAGRDLSDLRIVISGASAVPVALSEGFRETTGLPLTQIWGMTETSPLGTIVSVKTALSGLDDPGLVELRATAGMPVPGIEIRIALEDGSEGPWDGSTSGELEVRGPWVASGYFGDGSPESFTSDGWLRTGDVATIDPDGYLRIVDRIKDVIKSGGEWISSIELENQLMSHPAVSEAAVVGVASERWGERPLACVVVRDGATVTAGELQEFLGGKVASWWIPDQFEFIDAIPRTSVGKFAKNELRDEYRDLRIP